MATDTASSRSPGSSSPPPARREALADAVGLDLAALGAETDTTRAVNRILPWVVSVALHAAMLAIGFLVTWTVVMMDRDREPALIVADFDSMVYEPLARMPRDQAETDEELVQDRLPVESSRDRLEERLDLDIDPMSMLSERASASAPPRFEPDPTRATATFVGLSSTNARRVVYVIDASGSMIRSLPVVIDELARSLDGLTAKQEFSVIFFMRNEALTVPPESRLSRATEEEKMRVLAWIDEFVIPSGRSNPLQALEKAMSFRPDVIFLLSENITGSGEFEIDQADLLALLNTLNPVDPATGRRATTINCVQFLDPDPLGTLEKIAMEHGGPRGYKFLDREELGLKAP